MGLSDLPTTPLEALWSAVLWSLSIAVIVASYRRSRLLSGYPIWRSALIAVLAGIFAAWWFVAWAINRERIAAEWNQRELRLVRTEPSSVTVGP